MESGLGLGEFFKRFHFIKRYEGS